MFRVTARTILELGSELISSDIIAFYELIKNGFDAKTKNGVDIKFDIAFTRHDYLRISRKITEGMELDELKLLAKAAVITSAPAMVKEALETAIHGAKSAKDLQLVLNRGVVDYNSITVSDTGSGMTLAELDSNFLVIGTASRKKAVEAALASKASGAPFLGEKGIGRLSAMRLGEKLRVVTTQDGEKNYSVLEINWRDFGDLDAMLDQIEVAPVVGAAKEKPSESGTSIIISDLTEHWSEARVREMTNYDFARLSDPFEDAANRPRIGISWNGDRVAIPMMPAALLGAAHARISGKYEIEKGEPSLTCTVEALDLGYDHPRGEKEIVKLSLADLEAAIIGKDGSVEDAALASVGPFSFEAHWYNRRRLSGIDGLGEQRVVRELQEKWSGILLFRDGFRVFPYGEDDDDWLGLDRRAFRRSGYTLNKTQFIGRVNISRTANPKLVDQTNREGLRVTPEQQVLLQVLQYAVQDRLGNFLNSMERQYRHQKIDLGDAQERVRVLEDRAKKAIAKLRVIAPEGDESVEDLQQTLFEFSEFAANARKRIAEVEDESRQLIEMAGVGLMVEVVAHELARASETALKALGSVKSKDLPEKVRAQFATLQTEMKSISKRVRVLDPLSVSGRQRTEAFALDELIRETCEAHEAQFNRHNVQIKLDLPEKPLRVRAVKGMIVQILENLISNSVYWLDMRAEREKSFRPRITISLEKGPPTLSFEDNGRGIATENREQIFKAFFSLKETKRRRGLGLFIAREAAEHHAGRLYLDETPDKETGRLHRFVLELPAGAEL